MSDDESWSSSGGEGGAAGGASAAPLAQVPAASRGAQPPASSSLGAGSSAAAPEARKNDPTQPETSASAAVVLYRYEGKGNAVPLGPSGCAVLSWRGTTKRAIVLYSAAKTVVATAAVWPSFSCTVASGVYLQFECDKGVAYSLLFPDQGGCEKFLAAVLAAKAESYEANDPARPPCLAVVTSEGSGKELVNTFHTHTTIRIWRGAFCCCPGIKNHRGLLLCVATGFYIDY